MKWEPIINESIYKQLSENKIESINNSLIYKHKDVRDFGLYSGKMGICLFFYYYSLYRGKSFTRANSLLSSINEFLSKNSNRKIPILWFSEFGKLLLHLKKIRIISYDVDDILLDLNGALTLELEHLIENDYYELLYGGTNIANYYLDYIKFRDINKYYAIDIYIDTLYKKAIHLSTEQIGWLSSVGKKEELYYDLGLAHGITAIILLLCELKKINYKHQHLDELLVKSCSFMLSHEQDPLKNISHFGNKFLPGIQTCEMSRIGWCYGDLTIGFALLKASTFLPSIKEKSIEILLDTTFRKSFQTTYLSDGQLCHGTFGVAHIYNRIYQETNDNRFKKPAAYWYKEGLRKPYYTNYPAGIKIAAGNSISLRNYTFLSGIAGIGLSLISSISNIEPLWDDFLLLS